MNKKSIDTRHLIEVKNICHKSLKGFAFDFHSGTVSYLSGPSASGKTACFEAIVNTIQNQSELLALISGQTALQQLPDLAVKAHVKNLASCKYIQDYQSEFKAKASIASILKITEHNLTRHLECPDCGSKKIVNSNAKPLTKSLLANFENQTCSFFYVLDSDPDWETLKDKAALIDFLKLKNLSGVRRLLLDGQLVEFEELGDKQDFSGLRQLAVEFDGYFLKSAREEAIYRALLNQNNDLPVLLLLGNSQTLNLSESEVCLSCGTAISSNNKDSLNAYSVDSIISSSDSKIQKVYKDLGLNSSIGRLPSTLEYSSLVKIHKTELSLLYLLSSLKPDTVYMIDHCDEVYRTFIENNILLLRDYLHKSNCSLLIASPVLAKSTKGIHDIILSSTPSRSLHAKTNLFDKKVLTEISFHFPSATGFKIDSKKESKLQYRVQDDSILIISYALKDSELYSSLAFTKLSIGSALLAKDLGSACGIWKTVAEFYANLPLAKQEGITEKQIRQALEKGDFSAKLKAIAFKGINLEELKQQSASTISEIFKNIPKVQRILHCLKKLRLHYLPLSRLNKDLSKTEQQKVSLLRQILNSKKNAVIFLKNAFETMDYAELEILIKGVNDSCLQEGCSVILMYEE